MAEPVNFTFMPQLMSDQEKSTLNAEYVNTLEYKALEKKLKDLTSLMGDLASRNDASRRLRYVEIDIDAKRQSGELQPDEMYIPLHIADTNIRREQSSYVGFVSQSPRACIFQDANEPSKDCTVIEKDFTNRVRYPGWQVPMFRNIDGMQQSGYGMVEVVFDKSAPGHVRNEYIMYGDFGIPIDTRDIQDAEIIARNYYYTKTTLLDMSNKVKPNGTPADDAWDLEQVKRIVGREPSSPDNASIDSKEKSLYKVTKYMFRFDGTVWVGWSNTDVCDDWCRKPRRLFLGRKEVVKDPMGVPQMMYVGGRMLPVSKDVYETLYPYFIFPYLISENDTVADLKGRVSLDQDVQQAASSIASSYCTGLRRAAGTYFSKDGNDPNADLVTQKNVFLKSGCLVNSKITQFQMDAPPSECIGAINLLIASNQQETSQVNYAVQNRKDSRKTAEEIKTATQEASKLTTVQVVLFSNALRNMYNFEFGIVQSRVAAGLIVVSPSLSVLYSQTYNIRPAGDIDVIERQQRASMMMNAWPVMQQTPIASYFLMDMISALFPERAEYYNKIIQQQMEQQANADNQKKQQMISTIGNGLVKLAKRPEFFSEAGRLYALPGVQLAAEQIEGAANGGGQ